MKRVLMVIVVTALLMAVAGTAVAAKPPVTAENWRACAAAEGMVPGEFVNFLKGVWDGFPPIVWESWDHPSMGTVDFIVGTEDSDVFTADQSRVEVFCGLGGDDALDFVNPGDIYLGGAGDDSTDGIAGVFFGGAGDDTAYYVSSYDVYGSAFFGGAGDDQVIGGPNYGRVYGGEGADWIWRNEGEFHGGLGNDAMWNNRGTYYGDGGDDMVYENAATFYGGPGNDTVGAIEGFMKGWNGDPAGGYAYFYGEAGEDGVYFNRENATFDGGPGTDWYWYNYGTLVDVP